MKKYLSIICGVLLVGILAISLTSCTKEEKAPAYIKSLKFNVTVKNGDADTKVVKTAWENGDKIYVFFNVTAGSTTGYLNPSKYVVLTYNESTKKWDGALGGALTDANELGTAGKMYGVYFPYGGVTITSDGAGGVTFRSAGNTNPALNGLPIFTYYMLSDPDTEYTIVPQGDVGNFESNFVLRIPDKFVFFFIDKDGANYYSNEKYRLSIESIKPVACSSFKEGTFSTTTLLGGQPLWGYTYGNKEGTKSGMSFTGMIQSDWTTAQTHKFVLFSDGDPAVTKSFTGKTLTGKKSINLGMASGWTQAVTTPTLTEFFGKKWANWNLGATAVDGVGLYLQWGGLIEPEQYKRYGFDGYRDYGDGSYVPIKSILGSSNNLTGNYLIYDAARAYLGDGWRMPTRAEFDAFGAATIIDAGNTTETVGPVYGTDPAQFLTPSARKGVKFVNGTSSIFLPSSGFWQAADNRNPSDNPKKCAYWTSTTYNETRAYYMDVYTTTGSLERSWQYRAHGRQIRPIYDK
ncbi:MAG: hypothetical protein J5604_04575 [Bacteroidales bacterium]|nr:hypothetical protein [Bacteroidales bacterium]